jgi:hypothetical protein
MYLYTIESAKGFGKGKFVKEWNNVVIK